jgi:chromosome segregation ATPase
MKKIVLVGVAVAALAAVLTGQGTTPDDGTMQALVTEIRALRADLNRVAGASIRAELLVGRLQLQEARTVTLSRQLDEVQAELGKVTLERTQIADRLKDLEDGTHRADLPPAERSQHERELRMMLKALEPREQQLRQQAASLSGVIGDEQARWTDFSSRLDELERALSDVRR